MFTFLTRISAAAALIFALIQPAHAALVSTDWKNNGDALATLDTDTGLEWLDLTQTRTLSISQVTSQLNSAFQGWRLPTETELYDLFRKTFTSLSFTDGTHHTYSVTMATPGVTSFFNFFGDTELDPGKHFTLGYCKQLLTKVRSFLLWSAYAATSGRFTAPLDETAVSPNQARF